MATTTPARPPFTSEQLANLLSSIVDERRVLVRPIDLIAFASDASFYRLIPEGRGASRKTSTRFTSSSSSARTRDSA